MDWQRLKKDREAGTPGPWGCKDGDIVPVGRDTDDVISTLYQGTPDADARRIARVPDLEALALAGRELAEAVEQAQHQGCEVCGGDCASANPPVCYCPMQARAAALARWKEAGGEDE